MKKHPLIAWLKENNTTAYALATVTGVSRRTLYSHLEGVNLNPTMAVMVAIEAGTKGGVSVQDQIDWFKARAR